MIVPEEEIIKNCIGLSAEEIKKLSYKHNDLSIGYQYYKRSLLVKRFECFENDLSKRMHCNYRAYRFCECFIIYGHKFGTLAYYPLKDAIFVCEKNVWLKLDGMKWIESNLILKT